METNVATTAAFAGAEQALSLWPWGILTAIAAFLCSMMILRMAGAIALRPLRRAASEHWTEKARLAYPGLITMAYGQIFQPLVWAVLTTSFWNTHGDALLPLIMAAAFLGAGIATTRIESKMREHPVSMLDWVRNWTVIILLFLPWLVVFIMLAGHLPSQFNGTALCMILVAVAAVLALSLGGTISIMRWIGMLRPAPQRLHDIVSLAVQRMTVKSPTVYVLQWKAANAFAFPFCHAIAVTNKALSTLADEELTAIFSHELAHLNEPRPIHFARLAGQFAWMPFFLMTPLIGTFGFPNGFFVAFVISIASHLCVQRMTLAMEKRADSAGKAHEGEAGTYARALEKLYEINLMPAVLRSKNLTHPHLYDRLITAGIQPDYPRPAPPSRWRAKAALVFLLAGTLTSMFLWLVFVQAVRKFSA